MQDVAAIIVRKAMMMPMDTGVGLECNGATITKVRVTGGFGLEVASGGRTLLFPMAGLLAAVESFLTTAHLGNGNQNDVCHVCDVRHTNGVPLLQLYWNDDKRKRQVVRSVSDILLCPPICREAETPPESTVPTDVRGLVGWDVDSAIKEMQEKKPSDAEDSESGEDYEE